MAINQTNKIVWLVNTLMQNGRLSYDEINKRWVDSEALSNGAELPKRTFHKWIDAVFNTFGIIIENENHGDYRYYIANKSELRNGRMERWLIDTYSISNSILESSSIKDRIILEEVPSGREFLTPIIDAMKINRFIHITYYNYWSEETREHYIMPLCVKLFRQRWYMVGRLWTNNEDILFCLDRIKGFRLSSHSFEYPSDFEPNEYFNGCYGIIADKKCKVQDVLLKVSAGQSNYLRDLPMMQANDQQEIERNDEYSIFRLRVRPTYDFQQELLWHREELEVLEPLWLRKEIAGIIKRMWNKYNKQ